MLGKIWCYYEAFLGQTLLLNAEPIRELAKSFTNLKVRATLTGLFSIRVTHNSQQNSQQNKQNISWYIAPSSADSTDLV